MPLSDEDRAALSAYLDGELDDESTRRIEVRLSLDAELRAEFDTLRQTWGLLDYLPQVAPAADFTSRTLDRLSHETLTSAAGRWISRVLRRVPATALAWSLGVVVALGLGMTVAGGFGGSGMSEAELDEALVRHLRIAERWQLYQAADNIELLRELDKPDLFGGEPGYGGGVP